MMNFHKDMPFVGTVDKKVVPVSVLSFAGSEINITFMHLFAANIPSLNLGTELIKSA